MEQGKQMTSLTRTAISTRRGIRYGVYFIIFIIIGRAALLGAIKIYRYFFPVPPPPPTVAFGKLPTLPFPDKPRPDGLTFVIETPEGGLPTLPDQSKVYFMPKLSTQLLSLESAKTKAKQLGFSAEEAEVTETVYKFQSVKAPAELQISIATGVFSIGYNLAEDPSPLERVPMTAEVAASKVRSYLSGADLLPDDLTGSVKSEYVKLENQKIVGAGSLSNANFVKINYFRKDYDELPSLTFEPDKGNVWFIVSGDPLKEKMIIAAEYHYFPVDESKYSTYPIKTSQQAWEEFSQGKAYVAAIGSNTKGQTVKIRRVYLAYYDAGVATNFYQPIIVFEGDRGFISYIPAVTAEYYGDK